MLIQHGENGFLFDAEKPSELAKCLRRVLSLTELERKQLVALARKTVSERLDPVRLCAERIDYYQVVASTPRPTHRDDWLQSVLAPRPQGNERSEILRAFTTRELATATVRQMVGGIKRRISAASKDI